MLLLEVNNLSCSIHPLFAFRRKAKPILIGASLAIEEGQSVALLGGSGSGKTTLAKCITGLLQPDAGTIVFNGVNIYPKVANRKSVGLEMQMLFQSATASLDPAMMVADSLLEGINARGEDTREEQQMETAGGLLSSVGLQKEVLDRFPHQLSGGERQRVALARALAVSPRLLILDEPTSALDALTSAHLLALLKSLQVERGFAILYITHDVQAAFSLCDRAAVLHGGRVVEEGTTTDILGRPRHVYTTQLLRDSRLLQYQDVEKGGLPQSHGGAEEK